MCIRDRNINEKVNRKIIRGYTRESGVRNLEREISKIARKVVKKIDAKEKVSNPILEKDLNDYLGIEKFTHGEIEKNNRVGRCFDRQVSGLVSLFDDFGIMEKWAH